MFSRWRMIRSLDAIGILARNGFGMFIRMTRTRDLVNTGGCRQAARIQKGGCQNRSCHNRWRSVRETVMAELIQAYDAVKDVWEVIGTLPYPLKGHSAVVNNGWLYFFCGQKSKLPSGREPGAIINSGWRARVSDLKS